MMVLYVYSGNASMELSSVLILIDGLRMIQTSLLKHVTYHIMRNLLICWNI